MKRKFYSEEEKAIWLRGKIAGYYSHKAKVNREKKRNNIPRYSNFDVEKAFEKAIERSYKS